MDVRTALAVKGADIRTEGELWAEAYKRDLQRQPPGLLEAACEAATQDGATEPDEPLWPDPGTPKRERLDRKNAAIIAGLLEGYHRHRALFRGPRVLRFDAKAGLPPGAVYIGRAMPQYGLPASKWANPFRVGRDGGQTEVIARYRDWLLHQPELMSALPELRGCDLVSGCAPEACHGDLILQLANGELRS